MKCKAIVNLGTNDYGEYAVADGETVEVPERIGCKMVKAGHAVEIIEPKPREMVKPAPVASDEDIITPGIIIPPPKPAPVAGKPQTTPKK